MDKQVISTASAKLDDAAAMEAFLAPMPNGEALGKLLSNRKSLKTRAYDDEDFTARYISSDGTTVLCCTITAVTIDQAEMIATGCEVIESLSPESFRAAVELALGDEFNPLE